MPANFVHLRLHTAYSLAESTLHAKAIENASVEELSKIKGISDAVARTIYDHLHTVND